jgi:hypothetical protein
MPDDLVAACDEVSPFGVTTVRELMLAGTVAPSSISCSMAV